MKKGIKLMRILSRINSLEKKILKENKKCIVLSIPYCKSKTEKQNVRRLTKEYIATNNLKADSFVFIVNYSKTNATIVSEYWCK